MKNLALILGVIHSLSALVLLIFSGWFIAACAIAGLDYAIAGFNYMLPAVLIRALALTRIASGYAQMWVGHKALLAKVKTLRLELFERVKNQIVTRRAEATEALAKHSEVIAGISMAWTVHNLAFIFIILMISTVVWLLLNQWFYVWLGFLATFLCFFTFLVFRIKQDEHEILRAKTSFRHTSEHHLSSASLWHLRKQIKHPNMQPVYARIEQQRARSEILLWWVQCFAFLTLLYVLHSGQYLGQATMMMFVLLLLAAKDWFSPILRSQSAWAQYRESTQSVHQLPLQNISRANSQPELINQLSLNGFSVANRALANIDLQIHSGEIVLLKGGSGSGKTSLLKAIAGLLAHTGEKQVNGINLEPGFIDTWHYSDQQPTLISASLAANLRLARPNASDEELKDALCFAGLSHLSDDLSQWVGSQGRQLSGGELKRFNVARAYLFDAQLYLFDEPFEGLDAEHQTHLAKAISSLSARAPIIIASHIVPTCLQAQRELELS